MAIDHVPGAGEQRPGGVLGRVERLGRVGSTNDVVRSWLAAGEAEVCVAIADEQTAGRGRHGRSWVAPPGAALLCSVGFRPRWLEPDRAWRLAATVALAMADAAEEAAGLPEGAIRLKWPNDLVVEVSGPNALLVGELSAAAAAERLRAPVELRKLGGVLGESDGLGTDDPRVVVGIGINADWAAAGFPPSIAASMTSLREAAAGRPIDRDGLLTGFLDRLEARTESLRLGYFDIASWAGRQATTGRLVTLEAGSSGGSRHLPAPTPGSRPAATPDGGPAPVPDPGPPAGPWTARALGVDAASGGLVLADPSSERGERIVHAGEVVRLLVVPGEAGRGPAAVSPSQGAAPLSASPGAPVGRRAGETPGVGRQAGQNPGVGRQADGTPAVGRTVPKRARV
jgi:biotin-[acetyl-CoA-carboxylase] ligase BirA-like protein